MRKYWLIIKNTWEEYGTYRLNFILWRVRVVIRFLITYFLWSAIYPSTQNYFGYNRTTMLTYVLLVYLVSNFVFATRTQEIGTDINDGRLTNLLLRPINYFSNLAFRDIADKLINFIFTVLEICLLLLILHPPLVIQTNIFVLTFTILGILGAIIIYFCMSTLLGFIGFWTPEIWAVRFIFMIILDFLAGNFFPIDILPKDISQILLLTPFPYMFYFPAKIYLGQLSQFQIFQGFGVISIWTIVLIYAVNFVWKKGLRVYSAEGR